MKWQSKCKLAPVDEVVDDLRQLEDKSARLFNSPTSHNEIPQLEFSLAWESMGI